MSSYSKFIFQIPVARPNYDKYPRLKNTWEKRYPTQKQKNVSKKYDIKVVCSRAYELESKEPHQVFLISRNPYDRLFSSYQMYTKIKQNSTKEHQSRKNSVLNYYLAQGRTGAAHETLPKQVQDSLGKGFDSYVDAVCGTLNRGERIDNHYAVQCDFLRGICKKNHFKNVHIEKMESNTSPFNKLCELTILDEEIVINEKIQPDCMYFIHNHKPLSRTMTASSIKKITHTYTEDFDFFGYDFEDFGSLAVV
tara:strand:- start:586 stop:1338 length:753 start_codon:yes stop_codon:yes gene_type:complete